MAQDDATGMILKLGVLGVAGYLGWRYLESSGLLAQFGLGGYVTGQEAQMVSYCASNPNGQTTYNGQAVTCAQILQAAHQASGSGSGSGSGTSTSGGGTTTTPPPPPPPPPTAALPTSAQLDAWMLQSRGMLPQAPGSPPVTATADQWCYAANHLAPGSCPSLGTHVLTCAGYNGTNRASMPKISSSAFLTCAKAGLSGLFGYGLGRWGYGLDQLETGIRRSWLM